MTNPKSALLVMLMDRSGSMWNVKEATIEGMTTVLHSNAQLVEFGVLDYITAYIAQFDTTPYAKELPSTSIPFNIPLDGYQTLVNFERLDHGNLPSLQGYEPRGGTALYDSVIYTIDKVGDYLTNLPERLRPGKVHMLINTDGRDNASKKWNANKVREVIKHQTEKYAWEFSFYGSNLDSVLEARDMGIQQTTHYESNNTSQTFSNAAKSISRSFSL
jgi:hypothetical protein